MRKLNIGGRRLREIVGRVGPRSRYMALLRVADPHTIIIRPVIFLESKIQKLLKEFHMLI